MSARSYRPETRLVHSGILRSQFQENAEALYLTQSYVYDSAASAEARFKGSEPGYIYSRYGNPTLSMFETRMAEFEGAEAARATATGMAAVTLALMGQVRAGDHVVAAKASGTQVSPRPEERPKGASRRARRRESRPSSFETPRYARLLRMRRQVYRMGALTEREAGRMSQIIPWSFEPAGLQPRKTTR